MITKKEWARPVSTAMIWAMPTMTYTLQKTIGVQMNTHEWLWWAVIPGLFVLWFFINFKLVKSNEQ
jgi:FtsH-binding integral membrane protein